MATTVIRSTDAAAVSAGAILTGNAGSLVAVLDYALVTVLGWGKPFTATNKGVYRAPAGVRHYLDVDDSGPDGTALGRNARVRGYETMSAVATGTGLFPTTTQVTTAVGIVKSTATGTTARPWLIVGDDRTFYLFVESAGTDPPTLSSHTWTSAFYFGEILSVNSGDLYRSMLGFQSTTTAVITAGLGAFLSCNFSNDTIAIPQAMPRSYTGAGTAAWVCLVGNPIGPNAGQNITTGSLPFPNPADGGLYMNAVDVFERGTGTTALAVQSGSSGGCRGRLRGVYQALYTTTGYNDQDTFTGTGDFTGRTFLILKLNGMIAVETTAWAASS